MKKEHSTLLLQEMVLPDVGCSWRNASLDMIMMMWPGGMERTRQQWSDLLEKAGLEIVQVWTDDPASESVIEAQLKQ